MAIPSMGYAAIGVQVAGAIMSASAAYSQGKQQQSLLGYQAAVAKSNAAMENALASLQLQVGAQQEQTVRIQGAQQFGAQRAAMAANGIDLGYGTATEILASTQHQTEVNALTIRDNSARAAWQNQAQAVNFTNEAAADSVAASNINPGMSSATSLLGGIASAYSSYATMSKGS